MYTTATTPDNTGMADELEYLTVTAGEDATGPEPTIYIQIRPGGVERSRQLDPQIRVDWGEDNRVVGIQVAGARFIGTTLVPKRDGSRPSLRGGDHSWDV